MKIKTPEIRARELYALVYGQRAALYFNSVNSAGYRGWIKLGKFVLSLERKWAKAKKGGK